MVETVESSVENVGRSIVRIATNGAAAGPDKLLCAVEVVPALFDLHALFHPFIAKGGKRQFGNHLEPAPVVFEVKSFVRRRRHQDRSGLVE